MKNKSAQIERLEVGLEFQAVTPEELGAQAGVIITITSAFEPMLMMDWIKPGTHRRRDQLRPPRTNL